MSNTFMKKGFRGFTLIELLVVIAIIGLLSTVIATPIQNARKKAKDVKKMAELKAVQSALDQYAEANGGSYPDTLAALSPQYMTQLPTFASVANSSTRDAFAYVTYTATPVGGAATTFGYHLGVHLDVYAEPLKNDANCFGSTVGVVVTPPACVWFNTTGAITTAYTTYTAGMLGTATNADFDASAATAATLDPSNTCVNVNNCIFDLAGQY